MLIINGGRECQGKEMDSGSFGGRACSETPRSRTLSSLDNERDIFIG